MPINFEPTSQGEVFLSNGIDPVMVFNPFRKTVRTAGVIAPTVAVTVAGSGNGAIVGDYVAYLRFVDEQGNYSNPSPVSNEYRADGNTGGISNATNATPIVITSPAHELTDGTTVKIEGVGGNEAANNTYTITVVDADSFELDSSSGDGDYIGGGTWASGLSTITYTTVQIPQEAKIVRRQILRNTDGQFRVFYVDVDTTDLSSSTLSSTNDDNLLSAGTVVTFTDINGTDLSGIYGIPPDTKAVYINHFGRMYALAETEYSEGNVAVTFGGTTVTGIGTEWKSTFPGRMLHIDGATKAYEIATVDTVNQTLTLAESYDGPTNPYSLYSIRPEEGQRRLIYYSEAGLPEAFSPTNAISLPESGDTITGAFSRGSFLYFMERRHLHRWTVEQDPAKDGQRFEAANRGCLNQRCCVLVDDKAFLLDEGGIYSFTGGQDVDAISSPIQTLFRSENEHDLGITGLIKINWDASRFFHALHYPEQQTIRWFVALTGSYLPKHALVFNYAANRWWIEEYPRPIGASTLGKLGRTSQAKTWGYGTEQPFLGTDAKTVLALWRGTLDGVDANAGTVLGTVSSSGIDSLTDATSQWADTNLVNNPIVIIKGRGKGQIRRIVEVDGTTLRVNTPWAIRPDSTSQYQLGGIQWLYRTGWFDFVQEEESNQRGVKVNFEPTEYQADFDLRVFFDYDDEPETFDSAYGTALDNPTDIEFSMQAATPNLRKRFDHGRELNVNGPMSVAYEIAGVQNKDRVIFYGLSLDGVE